MCDCEQAREIKREKDDDDDYVLRVETRRTDCGCKPKRDDTKRKSDEF